MRSLLLMLCAATTLASCGDGKATLTGSGEVITLDGYCDRPGLAKSLRQTVIVIDQNAVVKAERAGMREANRALYDLVLGLADPTQIAATGASAPREPVTIYMAPAGGGALKLLFSGCPPVISSQEQAGLTAKRSGMANFGDTMSGDSPRQKAEEAGEQFRRSLGAVLAGLGEGAPARPTSAASIDEAPLVRGLQGMRNLAPPERGVVRLVLFTDLGGLAPEFADPVAARRAGFEAAARVRLSLGLAEVHLAGPGDTGRSEQREFADAFILGSQGDLASWGTVAFNALPNPPVEVRDFTGSLSMPPNTYPMQMRLGVDKNGALVASWVTMQITERTSTPLTGGLSCDARGACRLTTDGGGFAQVWSDDPDAEAEYAPDMPLSGLRNLEAEVRGSRMTGSIFDPDVYQIGATPGVERLTFTLNAQ